MVEIYFGIFSHELTYAKISTGYEETHCNSRRVGIYCTIIAGSRMLA